MSAEFKVHRADVQLSLMLTIGEAEARALDALVGYGVDSFLLVFYKHLGEVYMKPNEAGLRTLFESIRAQVPSLLERIDKARAAFKDGGPR